MSADTVGLLPAADCLQLDATRGGYTGCLRGAALAQAPSLQLSAHCAPALHPVDGAVGHGMTLSAAAEQRRVS